MSPTPTKEQQDIYVTIWAKAVDTQMHFNEMCVKSRQFGLGFVAAALGLGIALLSRKEDYSLSVQWLGGFDIDATVLIILASAGALHAVRILDLNVYHKMLRGAVTFGEDFEENYMKQIFDLQKGMTQAISHFSRHNDASVKIEESKYRYFGNDRNDAGKKIEKFYNFSIVGLIFVAVALFFITAKFGHPSHV